MSKSKLTGTVISTDGSGAVEVSNSSTITGGTPVNNLEKASSVKIDKALTGFSGKLNNSLAGKVLTHVGTAYKKSNYDPTAFYKSVKDLGNNFTKNIDSLGGKVLTNVLKNSGYLGDPAELVDGLLGASKGKPLTEMIKYQKDQIKMIVNGTEKVVSDIKDFDIDSVGSVLSMINGIVSDTNLATALNLTAEFAMLKELNDSSLLLGLAGTIDCILEYKKDKKEQRLILLDGLPIAVRMSNIEYINTTIDRCGLGSVWSRCPDIIAELLASYKFDGDSTYPTEYNKMQLVSVLDRLYTDWEFIRSVGTQKINLNVFTRISSDASATLSLDDRFKEAITIANMYMPREANAAFKSAYKWY